MINRKSDGVLTKIKKHQSRRATQDRWMIFLLSLLALHTPSWAKPTKQIYEHWLILQGRWQFKTQTTETSKDTVDNQNIESPSLKHALFLEYIQRDFDELGSGDNFLKMLRVSHEWISPFGHHSYQIGGAYLDFTQGSPEYRAHAFWFYRYPLWSAVGLHFFNRAGFELRHFEGEPDWGTRWRNRIQLDQFLWEKSLGLSVYDEFFYMTSNNQNRLAMGLNENRIGIGLFGQWRMAGQAQRWNIYWAKAYLDTTKVLRQFEWIQWHLTLNW